MKAVYDFIRYVKNRRTPPEDTLKEVAAYLEKNPPKRPSKGHPSIPPHHNQLLTISFVYLRELFTRKKALAILADRLCLTSDAIEKRLLSRKEQQECVNSPVLRDFSRHVRLLKATNPDAYAEFERQVETLEFIWDHHLHGGPLQSVMTGLYPQRDCLTFVRLVRKE